MNNTIKWLATLFTIVGAGMVSLKFMPYHLYALNIGSILWLWWSLRIKEWSIVAVNVALLAIYIIGLFV